MNDLEILKKSIKDINTIENLINRVKELEEIEKEHQKINGELQERIKILEEEKQKYKKYWQQALAFYEKDYVRKYKIKEKIEDYTIKSKHPLVNAQSRREYTFGIRALQELLEEV